jgi:alkylation response protein AidB-like acyl-CoA dehydrogenase
MTDDDTALFAEAARDAIGSLGPVRREPIAEASALAIADEMGWFDLLVPEDDGGLGATLAAAAGVCMAAGEVAFPGAIIEKIALGSALGAEQNRGFGFGWVRSTPSGTRDALVHLGDPAEPALLAIDGESALFEASVTALDTELAFGLGIAKNGRPSTMESRIAPQEIVDRWLVLGAAYEAGMARAALTASVEYAKVREQFGRPIGTFQAMQQILAQMEVSTASAEQLVAVTASDLDASHSTRFGAIATRAYVARAARHVVESAVQVHGGVGFTKEVPLHLYLQRSQTWVRVAGSPSALAERIGYETLESP